MICTTCLSRTTVLERLCQSAELASIFVQLAAAEARLQRGNFYGPDGGKGQPKSPLTDVPSNGF